MFENNEKMDKFVLLYQKLLKLESAAFSRITHDEAMVAIVYKITQPHGEELILKISENRTDYLRELYFLKHFENTLPVPHIVAVIPPEKDVYGAVLMKCLPGRVLKKTDFTPALAYKIGSLLACIHLNRVERYGDLTQPNYLSADPRIHFKVKFEEGLAECHTHLSKKMLEQCRCYYETHLHLFDTVDGPCIVHRDFRAGNLMIDNRKISGIIDWSSGRASFAEEDFCPLEHGEWLTCRKKSFLGGYASMRPVPDYKKLMPLLRLNKAIATLGFTIKRGTWESCHRRIYQLNRHFLESFF